MNSVIVGGRAEVFSSHPHFKAKCIPTRGPDAVHLDLKAFFIYLQLDMLSFDPEKKIIYLTVCSITYIYIVLKMKESYFS